MKRYKEPWDSTNFQFQRQDRYPGEPLLDDTPMQTFWKVLAELAKMAFWLLGIVTVFYSFEWLVTRVAQII